MSARTLRKTPQSFVTAPAARLTPTGAGAIAAGAATGFVTAAHTAARAGAAPAPGLCWHYTEPSRTQRFWDDCQ